MTIVDDLEPTAGFTATELAEIEQLALAGDPDAPLAADAIPLVPTANVGDGLLPDWYMPAPMAGTPTLVGWRRVVAWLIVAAFLGIVTSGLCSTYGEVVIA